ncbi:nucleotidyltransferase [Parasphingorhabdus sp.]|uniref:nucleotidyltransferase domain-containing protein n=1 Tax=Parasphingorhabdus sp. TaxID=2709688 RepID=UPI0032656BD4
MADYDTSPALDELLLDISTMIELSDHDRKIAASRYRKLKEFLLRPESHFADVLEDDDTDSAIYAQGSMATSTTIVSGENDDRFDIDAIVDLVVPITWSDDEVLDKLYESLEGFPDAHEIERCTRCVQIRFATMHMDVTVLDRHSEPRQPRTGEIFHSPDEGPTERVKSNPYGFARWFRTSVTYPAREFEESITASRKSLAVNRLSSRSTIAKVDQEELPPGVPSRVDAQEVIALKLMKRFLNLRYQNSELKKPPSIYVAKMAVVAGYQYLGLTEQLDSLAYVIQEDMQNAINANCGPDRRNPSYTVEVLNDRWPATNVDRTAARDEMAALRKSIQEIKEGSLTQISKMLTELFGENVAKRSVEATLKRRTAGQGGTSSYQEKGTGAVLGASILPAPAIAKAPKQDFHSGYYKNK